MPRGGELSPGVQKRGEGQESHHRRELGKFLPSQRCGLETRKGLLSQAWRVGLLSWALQSLSGGFWRDGGDGRLSRGRVGGELRREDQPCSILHVPGRRAGGPQTLPAGIPGGHDGRGAEEGAGHQRQHLERMKKNLEQTARPAAPPGRGWAAGPEGRKKQIQKLENRVGGARGDSHSQSDRGSAALAEPQSRNFDGREVGTESIAGAVETCVWSSLQARCPSCSSLSYPTPQDIYRATSERVSLNTRSVTTHHMLTFYLYLDSDLY